MLYTRFILTAAGRPITRQYKPPCSPACSRQVGHRTKDMFNGSAALAERLELALWIYGYWPVAELLRAVCFVGLSYKCGCADPEQPAPFHSLGYGRCYQPRDQVRCFWTTRQPTSGYRACLLQAGTSAPVRLPAARLASGQAGWPGGEVTS